MKGKEIAKENKPYNQVMKEATIRAILRNETYLPESGLYQRIFNRLYEMSLTDLQDLLAILDRRIMVPRGKDESSSVS